MLEALANKDEVRFLSLLRMYDGIIRNNVSIEKRAFMPDAQFVQVFGEVSFPDEIDVYKRQALHEFYQKIKKEGSEIIYSDMDIIDAKGKTRDPLCKPDWSPDLFLSQMYLGHLIGFKLSLIHI